MQRSAAIIACLLLVASSTPAVAQNPLERLLPRNKSDNLPRLPNDQIEGTIWEYKGTLKTTSKDREKAAKKDGEKAPELDGRFRTEGKAIFDISRRLPIPSKKDVQKVVRGLKKGDLKELKLPAAPQAKRIGEYRKLSRGKLRLDFNDKESLNGIMIIWPKKKTADVWMGTFAEKKDKKTVRNWILEVRPIED